MLRRNVGGVDRFVRVVFGSVLFPAGIAMLATRTSYGATVAIVGFVLLMSGIFRSCGLYLPFGFSTAHPEVERIKRLCCGADAGEPPAAKRP